MTAAERALAVRRSAGIFRQLERGLVVVCGEDRTRWLQGMLSNDVAVLAPGPETSGCYAALLTPKGKIVADLQVLLRGDAFWLELPEAAVKGVMERLDRYIIADDVTLSDQSLDWGRIAIEGPAAAQVLSSAGVRELPLRLDAVVDSVCAGVAVSIARFGWTGELAFQIFVPKADEETLAEALAAAGAAYGLVEADAEVQDILRIEAGVPRLGRELSQDVLPDEARLASAISLSKGCYTGQEIVARLHSRGQVNRLLVGLQFHSTGSTGATDSLELPGLGAEIWPAASGAGSATASRPIGQLTSACLSEKSGRIALAFVRRAQSEPGTSVRVGDRPATVVALPFEAAGVSGDGLRPTDLPDSRPS